MDFSDFILLRSQVSFVEQMRLTAAALLLLPQWTSLFLFFCLVSVPMSFSTSRLQTPEAALLSRSPRLKIVQNRPELLQRMCMKPSCSLTAPPTVSHLIPRGPERLPRLHRTQEVLQHPPRCPWRPFFKPSVSANHLLLQQIAPPTVSANHHQPLTCR